MISAGATPPATLFECVNRSISQSEAQANPDMVVLFVQTDTNGDQIITPVEFVVVPIVDANGNPIQ